MQITTNAVDEIEKSKELLDCISKIESKVENIKTEMKFLTIQDVANMTGYSIPTVQKLFNRPDFPVWDIGKSKIVFLPAFYDYAMKSRKASDF